MTRLLGDYGVLLRYLWPLIPAVLALVGLIVYFVHYVSIGCPDNHAVLVQVCSANHAGGYTCVPAWRRTSGCP